MPQIKNIWINEHSRDSYNICVRFDGIKNDPPENFFFSELGLRRLIMPPRGLNLEQAKEQGLEEAHFVIGPFSTEALLDLSNQIQEKLA